MVSSGPVNIPALAILGPTASGKTALALELAQAGLPVEIISLDSALVFRDMDIGTAKPSSQELGLVPHHLIDIISPEEVFNASDFVLACHRLIEDIRARGKVPLIVGGTMMYYKALLSGLDDMPQANPDVRAAIEADAHELGWPALHERLMGCDPITASRLKPNDAQRIERALEVFMLTGKPLSHFHTRTGAEDVQLPTVSLEPSDRSVLHRRIEQRFHAMLDAGLPEELRSLQRRYVLDPAMPSMRCVGYRQVWEYLEGQIDHKTMIDKGVAATRQLAKRQITWLRSITHKQVLDPLSPSVLKAFMPTLHEQIKRLAP